MKKIKKRGIVDFQLNWIFAIVVGGLIVILFYRLIAVERTRGDISSATEIRDEINKILAGSGITPDKIVTLETSGDLELVFYCNLEEGLSEYYVGRGIKTPLNIEPVFSHTNIKGTNLVIQSLPWRMPFYVGTFLYITSSNIQYIFYNGTSEDNPGFIIDLYNKFPDSINKRLTEDISSLNVGRNDKVVLVYLEESNPEINLNQFAEEIRRERLIPIQIAKEGGAVSGSVYYMGRDMVPENTVFIDFPTLIAAIYSENKQVYECNMDKAIKRLKYSAKIYASRSEKISEEYGLNHVCGSTHGTARGHFNTISSIDNINSLPGLSAPIESLEGSNRQAQRQSCALIY